jgi:enoyl-CoA hydratase
MAYQNLLVSSAGGVVEVTVNRPEKLNALNAALIDELHACFGALGADPAARVIVLTGAGEKAFVAGADVAELAALGGGEAERLAAKGQALMWKIENLGKPVLAAVNGYALGGGCELALACTFRYASTNARLGLPEIGLGLIPGYGGTQRLPRLIGPGRALELILTGEPLTATEALAVGLVNRVVPREELMPAIRQTAGRIAARSAITLRLALKAVHEGANSGLDAACRLEAALFGVAGATADAGEGCRAFLEKRPPKFADR